MSTIGSFEQDWLLIPAGHRSHFQCGPQWARYLASVLEASGAMASGLQSLAWNWPGSKVRRRLWFFRTYPGPQNVVWGRCVIRCVDVVWAFLPRRPKTGWILRWSLMKNSSAPTKINEESMNIAEESMTSDEKNKVQPEQSMKHDSWMNIDE